MRAILILTGSELTRGETHDTNGPYLATQLTTLGVAVSEFRLVPDDRDHLAETFRHAIDRFDLVIVSGGLGPTADDVTVEVLAEVCGCEVTRDEAAIEYMKRRAAERSRSVDSLPTNFFKQAEITAGARVFANPVGLAPGFAVERDDSTVIVLPGVPQELRGLYTTHVEAYICERFDLSPPRILRAKVLGQGESWVEQRIQKLDLDTDRAEYGISAKPGELLLRFVCRNPTHHGYLDEIRQALQAEFGADLVILPEGLLDASGEPFDLDHARLVHELLLDAKATVATAESCTGGLVAKRLTDHAGSSAYFLGSVVAYQNEVKSTALGVDPALIEQHGAVSQEVCEAMAAGSRTKFAADYGIGITGIAGPGGGSDEKPVGLVYVGLARPDATVHVERLHLWGDRANVRLLAALRALDQLRRELETKPE